MVQVNFHTADGEVLSHDGPEGMSVMEIAVAHNVPGIDADCGGACACATCHVYVDPEWVGRLPAKNEQEQKMLAFAVGVEINSRLSCQITIGSELDGLTVNLPASQF